MLTTVGRDSRERTASSGAYAVQMGFFDKISDALDDAAKTVAESHVVDDVVEAAKSAGKSIKESGVIDNVVAASKEAAASAKEAYRDSQESGDPDNAADQ